MRDEILRCRNRIVEERALAAAASSPETAEVHVQLAKLYEIQLGVLTKYDDQTDNNEAIDKADSQFGFGELLARIA